MLKKLFAKFKREANPVLDAYRVKYMKKRFEELNQIGRIEVIWSFEDDYRRFQDATLVFPGDMGARRIRCDFGTDSDTGCPAVEVLPVV